MLLADADTKRTSIDIYKISNPLAGGIVNAYFPDCSRDPLCSNPVCDSSLSVAARTNGLVDAMTFEEKVNNTGNSSPGVPRLGLPPYQWWSEDLHGLADSPGVIYTSQGQWSYATSFPQPILMSAAFDDPLIRQVGAVVGSQGRAFSNAGRAGLDFWDPNVNPFRDPRWGRGQETPGEDALRVANYAYNFVVGTQDGVDPAHPQIITTCKHFAGYDVEDWEGNLRTEFDAIITIQDLSEYYLPSFKSCARDANVHAIMCSYNAVNGVPSCANEYLLRTILREHWGWNQTGQWVTSDCDAVDTIYSGHHYTDSPQMAAADAMNAGTDLDCGTTYPDYLGLAASEGLYANATLNKAIFLLYSSLVKAGYFDSPGDRPFNQLGWSTISPADQALANQVATEGMVLLKNRADTLPLALDGQKLALIGPLANVTTEYQGNYYGTPEYIRTLTWGAKHNGYKTVYSEGTDINGTSTAGFAAAVSMAAQADVDVIVYAGGIDTVVEAEAMDRYSIDWPGVQLDLIGELAQLDKPLIVLQFGGGQVDDTVLLANDTVDALLWCGYPSQAGGQAIFDVITGQTPPAGRLPITQYPGSYTNAIPMTDMNLRPTKGYPGRTYRWYADAVIPFGYGLHYTTFDVTWASQNVANSVPSFDIQTLVQQASDAPNLDLYPFDNFTVEVKNTGKLASDYVALLFVSTSNAGPAPYPIKTLIGYSRAASIQPGETRLVTIDVNLGAIGRTDTNGYRMLYPGTYTLHVDVDSTTSSDFKLTGMAEVLETFPQPLT